MSPYDRTMALKRDCLDQFLSNGVLGSGIPGLMFMPDTSRTYGPGYEVVLRRGETAYTLRWASVSDRGTEYYSLAKIETPTEVREIVVTRKATVPG